VVADQPAIFLLSLPLSLFLCFLFRLVILPSAGSLPLCFRLPSGFPSFFLWFSGPIPPSFPQVFSCPSQPLGSVIPSPLGSAQSSPFKTKTMVVKARGFAAG